MVRDVLVTSDLVVGELLVRDVVVGDVLVASDLLVSDELVRDELVREPLVIQTGRRAAVGVLGPRLVPLVTLGAASLAVAVAMLLDVGAGSPEGFLLLVAAVAIAELRPVHAVRHGAQRQSFTLTEGPLVVALALEPGRYTVAAVAAGVLIAQLRRGLPVYKTVFNVAQFAASTAVATRLVEVIEGVPGVIASVVAFTLINDALVRLVLLAATGRTSARPLDGAGGAWVLHVGTVTSIALLASHVHQTDPSWLPAFLAPAALVLWSQEQSTRRFAQARVVTALAEQASALYGGSSKEVSTLVTRTARHVLAADQAELVMLDGGRLVRVVDIEGTVERYTVPVEELSAGWCAEVMAAGGVVAKGRWAGVVVGSNGPRALLSAWREFGEEPFREPDLDLLSTLAETVEGLLDAVPADRRPGVLTVVLPDLQTGSADLQRSGGEVAEVLSTLNTVRQRLESQTLSPGIAEELRDAEQRLAAFVGSLVAPSTAPAIEQDGMVATGRWTGPGA